jgi:hypothetical protein
VCFRRTRGASQRCLINAFFAKSTVGHVVAQTTQTNLEKQKKDYHGPGRDRSKHKESRAEYDCENCIDTSEAEAEQSRAEIHDTHDAFDH